MKRYKRKLVWIILLTILFTGGLNVNINSYANELDRVGLPPIGEIFDSNSPIHRMGNYHLDTIEAAGGLRGLTSGESGSAMLNSMASLLFAIQKGFALLIVTIIYYAFEIDLYGIFSSMVDAVIGEMKIALFDELSLIAIVMLGFYYCVKTISNQRTQVWVAILQTVILLVLATGFFTNSSQILQTADEASKALSREVLTGTYRASSQGENPESATMAIVNDTWMMFVHRPWQIMNFESVEIAKKYEEAILNLPVGSEARKELVQEIHEEENIFKINSWDKRIPFMMLYALPMIFMGGIIGILALLILGYEVLTIFIFMLGIFIFIMALIPFFGISIVGRWAAKVISSAMIKVIVCFVLAIIFSFNAALFALIGVYGWLLVMILQLVVIVVIVWKKDTFIEIFTSMRMAVETGKMSRPFRKDANLESRINRYAEGNINKMSFNRKQRRKEDAYDYNERYTKSNNYSRKEEGKGIVYNTYASTIGENEYADNMNHAAENLKTLAKKAEELLEKKYEEEVKEAEEKAEKIGRPPEYTSFVNRVNTRDELGAERFAQREISYVMKQIKKTLEAGGSMEEMYESQIKNTPKKQQEAMRPKNIESVQDTIKLQTEEGSVDLDRQEVERISEEEETKKMIEGFNTHYNKNYDKAFFQGLIKEYGKENVEFMLKRMKEVEKREGKAIHNPAGYLVQGLKNNKRDQVGPNTKIEAKLREDNDVNTVIMEKSESKEEKNMEKLEGVTNKNIQERQSIRTDAADEEIVKKTRQPKETEILREDIKRIEDIQEKEEKVLEKLQKKNKEEVLEGFEEVVSQQMEEKLAKYHQKENNALKTNEKQSGNTTSNKRKTSGSKLQEEKVSEKRMRGNKDIKI